MLDVLSALLRLCGSCQALALASLAPSGQPPAAQPAPPTSTLIVVIFVCALWPFGSGFVAAVITPTQTHRHISLLAR